jgi:general stress protein 26
MKAEFNYFFKKGSELSEKGIVKLVHEKSDANLHYIREGNKLVALTLGTSNKIKRIIDNDEMKLAFANSSKDFIDTKVSIVKDQKKIKMQFNKMLEMNFTHFKKYNDDLVILELDIV